MKLFKNTKVFKTRLVLLLASLTLVGCTDYLDVDTDKDDPKVADNGPLLTSIEITIGDLTDFNSVAGGGAGQLFSVYTHQQTARGNEDQYGAKVNEFDVNVDWQNIYLNLTDIESLLKQAKSTNNNAYLGIAKVLKAYTMSVAVDIWGDVPFTEANKLEIGIRNPKYDNQKDIYDAVFSLIEEAKVNLSAPAATTGAPGTDDVFYGGDLAKWKRFANTLKLKLYNQTRLSPSFNAAGLSALLTENNFMTSKDDDFQFVHYNTVAPRNERNRLYVASYSSTQFGSYQSPWMYEILKGVNPNIHTTNRDPRMPYYYYNQLKANQLPEGGTVANPAADYWDRSSGFFSIRFASNGPNRNSSMENSYTYPGIFPAGGRYDDGLGGSVKLPANANEGFRGSGIAPKRILTYDEYLFIRAELMQVSLLPGSAATELTNAITANFAKVDQVVSNSGTSQTVPALSGTTAATTFIANIGTEFAAASTAKKLEIIMTQKWVATYGDPFDQYNDYRRTGYPVLADPGATTGEYQLNNGAGFPVLNDAETQAASAYQLSLFWPQAQLNINNRAPGQKNPLTYKIFWDN